MDAYYLYPQNPIPNPDFILSQIFDSSLDLEFLDHLSYESGLDQFLSSETTDYSNNNISAPVVPEDGNPSTNSTESLNGMNGIKEGNKISRVAIRTKTEMEIMDDGFKWKKYGKKMVKHSPNPRNYYKCSSEGCKVKKRVERDGKDPSYVITTYEGIHNHQSASMVYYTTITNTIPHAWSLQSSYSSSHSSP